MIKINLTRGEVIRFRHGLIFLFLSDKIYFFIVFLMTNDEKDSEVADDTFG